MGEFPRAAPIRLPPPGHPDRWETLRRLRRQPVLDLDDWLADLRSGRVEAQGDLLAVLAERFDESSAGRFLAWWLDSPRPDPSLASLLGRVRHPGCAALLRRACDGDRETALMEALLPLLGFQRDPVDFPRLAGLARRAGPASVRRAALEGLLVGLSAWPPAPLRRTLEALATDLDPRLAAPAVDALARLPAARSTLVRLGRRPLESGVAARLRRRLGRLPGRPLVLVAHGRAAGVIPAELATLAEELASRRQAPVTIEVLTAASPGPERGRPGEAVTLVPLFLLPGGHVRSDVPAIARAWRRRGPVRLLPFLGSWPSWQAALAEEVAELRRRTGPEAVPLLLHHPVAGHLAARYLGHLENVTGARCRPTAYTAGPEQVIGMSGHQALLPLALASSRLTESGASAPGPPLLARRGCRQALLELLEELP